MTTCEIFTCVDYVSWLTEKANYTLKFVAKVESRLTFRSSRKSERISRTRK